MQMNLFMKQKKPHRCRKQTYSYQREKGIGRDKLGACDYQIQTTKYKIEKTRPYWIAKGTIIFSLVQFNWSVMSDSSQPHGPQHNRPPCPSLTPRVFSNSFPLSRWCHPTISSSVIPFSSCLQYFPASGSFQMSPLFTPGGQNIGVSASTSILPMNTQDWSPLGWTGWISLQSKGLSRVLSNTTVQKHQFFSAQLSLYSNSHIHTWPSEKPQPRWEGPLLIK